MFSEHDIDQELKAALSVTPSPDFEARVRRRIDEHRASVWRWTWSYTWVASAAAVVVIAGTVMFVGRDFTRANPRGVGVSPAPAPQVVEKTTPPSAAPQHTDLASAFRRTPPPAASAFRRTTTSGPTTRRATDEPEVLVPPEQADAVRRLLAMVNAGRLQAAPPIETTEQIAIQPLIIEPIAVPGVDPAGGSTNPSGRGF